MSEPHHHVFNAIEPQIQEGVPTKQIQPLLDLLVQNGAFKKAMVPAAKRAGMKVVCGYLRNQDFETFLKFVECMCKLCSDKPGEFMKTIPPALNSIVEATKHYDSDYNSEYTKRVTAIMEQYELVEKTTAVVEIEEHVSEKLEQLTLVETESVLPPVEEQKMEAIPLGAEAAAAATVVGVPQVLSPFNAEMSISLPELPYVTKPERVIFSSLEGLYHNRDWDFTLHVPAKAVPEGQEITVKVGACSHGPFDIPENYHVASGFICVVASETFLEPVTLTLEHCLVVPDYQNNSEVAVLKSDHKRVSKEQFRFSVLTNTTPELSSESPHLTFKLKELCILCAALKDDENAPMDRSPSPGSEHVAIATTSEHHSPVKQSNTGRDNVLQVHAGHKRRRSNESVGREKRQRKSVEYAALFFEPKLCRKTGGSFNVLAFICRNCVTSRTECRKQAELELGQCAPISDTEFTFGHTKCIQLSLEKKRTPGWLVTLKNNSPVTEDDVNLFTLPLSLSDRNCLLRQCEMGLYPPRRVFEVCWSSGSPPRRSLSIEATIHNIERMYTPDQKHFSFMITAQAGGQGACQCCRSQPTSPPDQSLVGRLRERVIQGLSDSQRNQLARENHFAAAATDIKNFRYLCNMLNLTSKDITAIEYNHRYDGEKEQAYQALYKWMQCSELAINVGNLANVLASAGEIDAVNNLIEYCTHC